MDYVATSKLTECTAARNCPEHPSKTRGDRQLKDGEAVSSWPGSVQQPIRVIQVEGSSFRAFHYDLLDTADSLLSLVRGRKLWLLCHPGNTGSLLERFAGANDSEEGFSEAVRFLRNLSPAQKKQILYCVLDSSKTLYLPYAWAHSVITIVEEGYACSMWYIELPTSQQEVSEEWRKATGKGRCGGRRQAMAAPR